MFPLSITALISDELVVAKPALAVASITLVVAEAGISHSRRSVSGYSPGSSDLQEHLKGLVQLWGLVSVS